MELGMDTGHGAEKWAGTGQERDGLCVQHADPRAMGE